MNWKSDGRVDEESMNTLSDDGRNGGVTSFGYRKVPLDEKVHWVRGHFDAVAARYDFMNTVLSFGMHLLWKRSAMRMTGLNEGDRVIDVCGGTGDLSILAARAASPAGRVILYDINRAMMEAGRPRVEKSSMGKNIAYVQGDAERFSFPDETFDIAMVGFGIRNLTNMEKGFREMHRVLKPGGRLMCLEFSRPTAPWFRWLYDFYSFHIMPLLGWIIVGSRRAYTYLPESIRLFPLPDELSRMLEKIGFSGITYRPFTNGIAVVHLAEKEGKIRP
ncbi:MAG: bifunctional demethylmenaquinone methyltransferase/2-methoxy-6-polyprenyl-1,4-benzoquinol methylase UbiE [Pseudomonadota bacterium]